MASLITLRISHGLLLLARLLCAIRTISMAKDHGARVPFGLA